MLVVGGTRNGFAYNPKSDTWRALPLVPAGRVGSVAVWTGKFLLTWGGRRGGRGLRPELERLVDFRQWAAPGASRADRSLDWPRVGCLGRAQHQDMGALRLRWRRVHALGG